MNLEQLDYLNESSPADPDLNIAEEPSVANVDELPRYEVAFFSPEFMEVIEENRRMEHELLEHWQSDADSGDPEAQLQMGINHLYGIGGVERDDRKAFEYFEAAESGSPEADYWLGLCYMNGIGTDEDPAKGFALLKQAADHEDPLALCALGA